MRPPCEKCGKPATVHMTEIADGKSLQVHRCDACAKQAAGANISPRVAKLTHCSFCGLGSHEVGPMVEGPNHVYICANCTKRSQNIFEHAQVE